MKTIVITGAAGFIGSHLANYYVSAGCRVLGLDNYSSSDYDSIHAQQLRKSGNCELLECDVTSKADIDASWDCFSKGKFKKIDVIMNFACPASPPRYQAMPVETMMTCTLGVRNVLKFAGEHGAVVVHASTSEVYGDPKVSPQKESYRGHVNSYGPRACYDEGKRAAEALCYDYYNKFGLDVRLARIFNTYGRHMHPDDGRVVSNFICQALRGEPLTIYGNGSQTRSFCYVTDLVRGVVSLANLGANPQSPVNLGNSEEFTILELAQKVIAKLDGKLVHGDFPVDDPLQRKPDTSLAKKLLDWEPRVQLDEGLDMTIDYFRSMLGH